MQASRSCEEVHEGHNIVAHHHHHQQQQQQNQHAHQQIATTAFHISRPSHPISTIISPPPLHHASIILDDNAYHVSTIMLQNENFQVTSPNPPFLNIIFLSNLHLGLSNIQIFTLLFSLYRFKKILLTLVFNEILQKINTHLAFLSLYFFIS